MEKVLAAGDRVLSGIIGLFFAVMLLYSGYALWDTACIYYDTSVPQQIETFKPVVAEDNGPTFAQMQALNPDVCAWLTIPDTHIDYPVVQGKDDSEYLNQDVLGDFSLSGSIFLGVYNSRDFSDAYSIVYGHHMDYGAMFGDITEFTDADYFDAHPTGWLILPDKTYSLEFFACVKADAYDETLYRVQPAGSTEMQPLLDAIQANACQSREIKLSAKDQILALSTCAGATTNERVLMMAKMQEATEKEGK
jgi:sortase B